MLPQPRTEQKPQPVIVHRCNICGRVSADLIGDIEYAGGVGYVTTWHCKDITACWRRHDGVRR